jgi:hypothetical protein
LFLRAIKGYTSETDGQSNKRRKTLFEKNTSTQEDLSSEESEVSEESDLPAARF